MVQNQTPKVDPYQGNKNISKQTGDDQNHLNNLLASNLYPSLPGLSNPQDQGDKDEIESNLGWVEEQAANKDDGTVKYIEELGASKFVQQGKIKVSQTQYGNNNNQAWNQQQKYGGQGIQS